MSKGAPSSVQDAANQVLYLATSPDGGVLLDVANDQLLKLNSTGVQIWTRLNCGESSDAIAESIAKECEIEPERVARDISALLSQAASLGITPDRPVLTELVREERFVETLPTRPWYAQDDATPQTTTSRWTVVSAFLGLVMFDLILSMRSMKSLCRSVKTWRVRSRRILNKAESISQLCSAVEKACAWYPKKTLCLQRSAVLTCLLRRHGIEAQMVVGSRAMPMLAHAWVETGGAVINDYPAVRKYYHSMVSF